MEKVHNIVSSSNASNASNESKPSQASKSSVSVSRLSSYLKKHIGHISMLASKVVFLFSIMGKNSKISNGSKLMSSLAERSPDIFAGVDIVRCYLRR